MDADPNKHLDCVEFDLDKKFFVKREPDNIEQARAAADKWAREMGAIYRQDDPWMLALARASFLAGSAFKPGDSWESV